MKLPDDWLTIGDELKALDAHRVPELTVDRLLAAPSVLTMSGDAEPAPGRRVVRVVLVAAAVVVGLVVWRVPEGSEAPSTDSIPATPESTPVTSIDLVPDVPANGAVATWTFDDNASPGAGPDLSMGVGVEVVPGIDGSALGFSGVWPSSADAAGPVVDTAGSFSVSTLVQPGANRDCLYQSFVSQDGETVSGFEVGLSAACSGAPERFMFVMYDADLDASVHRRLVGTSSPIPGTWYHVVAVNDAEAGEMRLYVDGRLEATGPAATPWSATGPFVIGRARFSAQQRDYFLGAVDTTTVYDRALTDAEVAAL